MHAHVPSKHVLQPMNLNTLKSRSGCIFVQLIFIINEITTSVIVYTAYPIAQVSLGLSSIKLLHMNVILSAYL